MDTCSVCFLKLFYYVYYATLLLYLLFYDVVCDSSTVSEETLYLLTIGILNNLKGYSAFNFQVFQPLCVNNVSLRM